MGGAEVYGQEISFLHSSVHTSSWAHLATYTLSVGGRIFPRRGKQPRREPDHPPPSSPAVNNGGVIPQTPIMPSLLSA
jgi:hypothetical protein